MPSEPIPGDEGRRFNRPVVGRDSEVEIRFNDVTGLPSVRFGRTIVLEDVQVVDEVP